MRARTAMIAVWTTRIIPMWTVGSVWAIPVRASRTIMIPMRAIWTMRAVPMRTTIIIIAIITIIAAVNCRANHHTGDQRNTNSCGIIGKIIRLIIAR